MQRNSALRRAADVLKADDRCKGKVVKIVWTGERGVTVDDSFAFTQGQADLVSKFGGKFADTTLPAR